MQTAHIPLSNYTYIHQTVSRACLYITGIFNHNFIATSLKSMHTQLSSKSETILRS